MTKAVLNFDLNDPQDQEHFNVASKAKDLYFCLFSLDQELRSNIKYGNKFDSPNDALQSIRDFLHSQMDYYDLNFNLLS